MIFSVASHLCADIFRGFQLDVKCHANCNRKTNQKNMYHVAL
jgi:hypothetical protein